MSRATDRMTELDRTAQNPELPMADRAEAVREFGRLMGFDESEWDDLTDDEIVAEWCE